MLCILLLTVLPLHRIFSIDPPTARDLDDALSIEALPAGTFRVGVHIADVAFFVPPGSALDAEARERGTSVYLVDRVIPMLPRLLCEQLCSLNAGKAPAAPVLSCAASRIWACTLDNFPLLQLVMQHASHSQLILPW